QLGNYSVRLQIPPGVATAHMTVEALAYSAKGDGTLAAHVSVPVTLKYTDTMSVYAGFITANDCSTVTLFPRDITKTSQFVFSSVIELLKGPTPAETAKGGATAIPVGTLVNSLKQTGTAVS